MYKYPKGEALYCGQGGIEERGCLFITPDSTQPFYRTTSPYPHTDLHSLLSWMTDILGVLCYPSHGLCSCGWVV
jgi:hypothetical protein